MRDYATLWTHILRWLYLRWSWRAVGRLLNLRSGVVLLLQVAVETCVHVALKVTIEHMLRLANRLEVWIGMRLWSDRGSRGYYLWLGWGLQLWLCRWLLLLACLITISYYL